MIDLQRSSFLTFLTFLTFLPFLTSHHSPFGTQQYHLLSYLSRNIIPPCPSSHSPEFKYKSSLLSHPNTPSALMPFLPPVFVPSSIRSYHDIGVAYIQDKQGSPLHHHRISVATRTPCSFCSCPQSLHPALYNPTQGTSITPLVSHQAMA